MSFGITSMWSFIGLLCTHWVADFVFQSHWMASNKSKRMDALALHVGVYSAILLMASGILFAMHGIWPVFEFVALNGLLHFATDYATSRMSARLWGQQRWHDFFVIIGFDQLIHHVMLALTMMWFFGTVR